MKTAGFNRVDPKDAKCEAEKRSKEVKSLLKEMSEVR